MPLEVLLTRDAARDLEDIAEYISRQDAPEKANQVLNRLENALTSLAESPERGVYVRELAALGIREYREIFFKPYRIIYRVLAKHVYIMLIADGRRDMQTLLQRRLLEG
jgi:toxin ParE1/3/4